LPPEQVLIFLSYQISCKCQGIKTSHRAEKITSRAGRFSQFSVTQSMPEPAQLKRFSELLFNAYFSERREVKIYLALVLLYGGKMSKILKGKGCIS
jgi:hypothetical protein